MSYLRRDEGFTCEKNDRNMKIIAGISERKISVYKFRRKRKIYCYFAGRTILLLSLLMIFSDPVARAQAVLGISAGSGTGTVTHSFTQSGEPLNLSYKGPGIFLSGELSWDRVYFDMSLSMLLTSDNVKLGDDKSDISGYSSDMALDFNAFGIGYLYPFNEKFGAGGALGFHVSSIILKPEDTGDISKLRLGGYYGLIGLNLMPRLRYSVSNSFKITINIPLGFDFGAMSEEVVVGGVSVGKSPAIVQPETLKPEFKGISYGIYISAGYFFKLHR